MHTKDLNDVNNMNIVNMFTIRSLTGYTNLLDSVEKAEGPSNLVELVGQRKIRVTFANTAPPGIGTVIAGVTTNLAPTNIFYLTDVYSNATFSIPPCVVMSWSPNQSVDVLAQPEVISVSTNQFSWRVRSGGGINTNAWVATFIAVDAILLSGGGIGNADTVDGHHAGNGVGDVAINNNTLNIGLDSDELDGKHDWEYTINKVNNCSGAYIISDIDYGRNLVFNSSTPTIETCTLPSGNTALIGVTMSISRVGTGTLKIIPTSNDIILDSTNNLVSSVTSETYASVQLMLVTTNKWIAKSVVGTWESE
jgi:hypothetical protein